ncbi:DUF502 domain-containing protein [Hyphomicrobiales bacterium]|jgi:uncharacterized membrane protein|nr:DUF502 domain-containing protein [Rhodobiaceae bacterium]MBT5640150.1 DUF502 domain-containing protein [Rhodobiaceae bacterium]MDB4831585.1 DUF502 domain-containing protein [Hyphomicrobiales bacterium]MDC0139599.1 DUF502 domain-containing protein [Hyphomicrobiales bacterium]
MKTIDPEDKVKLTITKRIRSYFLTGLIIVAPLYITVAVTWWFINKVDDWFKPLIPNAYDPSNFLPIDIPGIGLIIGFITLTVLGFLGANFLGRGLVKYGESLLNKTPFIRIIYKGLKQIFETVFSEKGHSFNKAGLIEYPRKDIWAICFISTDTKGEVLKKISNNNKYLSVFLPTTPNPTSGFLLFLPEDDVKIMDMSVEDAAKLVISAGLVMPDDSNTD